MPKGGARSRSGPPPDPTALRRDRPSDQAGWVTLPIEGREGDPPAFPLHDPAPRESALWVELWSLPQAVMWEQLRLEREVALYVRAYVTAEGGTLEMSKDGAPIMRPVSAADRALVVRLADSLGLNTAGLARNRWKIGTPEPAAVAPAGESGRVPARERFAVINGGG